MIGSCRKVDAKVTKGREAAEEIKLMHCNPNKSAKNKSQFT